MKLIDANVLIYAVNQASEHQPRVFAYWNAALESGETIALPWPVILGFVRIATNARIFPQPLSLSEAMRQMEEWLARPNVAIIEPLEDHWQTLRPLIESTGTAGNLTMDAHLAALAIAHNATMVSCDGDFSRFRNLRWENPLAG